MVAEGGLRAAPEAQEGWAAEEVLARTTAEGAKAAWVARVAARAEAVVAASEVAQVPVRAAVAWEDIWADMLAGAAVASVAL